MPGPQLTLATLTPKSRATAPKSSPLFRNLKPKTQNATQERNMIVVMEEGATDAQVSHVVTLIKELGLRR